MISFSVIGLDQFLRTTPAQIAAQAPSQVENWLTDSLMAIPLFAAATWAGDRIACRAGIGTRRADLLKRALVISLLCALALTPVWFVVNKSDNPLVAQPLIFPHAQDSGDVYWVASWVILVLVCVCLLPVAAWVASGAAGGAAKLRRGAATFTRTSAVTLLVTATPLLAWLLHQAAGHAYASQVYYTNSTLSVPPRPHDRSEAAPVSRLPASPSPVTAAPYAFAYQAAHAVQDGLAGQAAGLPVAVAVLLWSARGPDRQNRQEPANTPSRRLQTNE